MTMPALTIWQPWAQLVIDGVKVHETRTWRPPASVVGRRLLIHAGSMHFAPERLPHALLELVRERYAERDEPLPYGALLGSVIVKGATYTQQTTPASWQDRTAGDWRGGRYAWEFCDPQPFKVPRPVRGAQGIWHVTQRDLYTEG